MSTEVSNDLKLVYDRPCRLQPACSAICENTSDGSPSEVTIKNLSSKNKLTVSIVLGQESKRHEIFPKETVHYPEAGPKNFDGKTLRISNTNTSGTEATAEVLLTAN